jgi:hypothetical protein
MALGDFNPDIRVDAISAPELWTSHELLRQNPFL